MSVAGLGWAVGTLAILARDTDQNVVVDVQGYFFPANAIPGYQLVQNGFATANATVVVGTVQCPAGKRVLGGGGTVIDPTWFMDSSVPTPSATGWQVRYRSSNGGTLSAAGSVWAICALVD